MSQASPPPGSLADLRREIESVDRSILLLLAARLEAAQRAIRLRAAHHRRLTDGAQERQVLERARGWARELGLPEPLVDQLLRTLIEEGKARFRSTEGPQPSGLVTVLLTGPGGPPTDLQGGRGAKLVAVPALR